MGKIRNFVIAALFSVAVFVPAGLVQAEWVYFSQARPLVSEIGAYTDASLSTAVALSTGPTSNLNYQKAAAHAKTADDMQNAIEDLYYWVGEYNGTSETFLDTYTYAPMFEDWYHPLRTAQALYSQYAANDIVNGKGRKWTASSLAAYNYCSKAASLGRYDALQP